MDLPSLYSGFLFLGFFHSAIMLKSIYVVPQIDSSFFLFLNSILACEYVRICTFILINDDSLFPVFWFYKYRWLKFYVAVFV